MVGGAHKENDIFSKGKRAQSVAAFEHATDLQIASITLIAHGPAAQADGGKSGVSLEEIREIVDACGVQTRTIERDQVHIAFEYARERREEHLAQILTARVLRQEAYIFDGVLIDSVEPWHDRFSDERFGGKRAVAGKDGQRRSCGVEVPIDFVIAVEGSLGMEDVINDVGDERVVDRDATRDRIARDERAASTRPSSVFISNFVFCIPNTKLVDAAADSIQTSVDQRGHGAQSDLLQRGHSGEHVGAVTGYRAGA